MVWKLGLDYKLTCFSCPTGGLLFAVNGPEMGPDSPDTQGLTLDINTGDLVSTWNIDRVRYSISIVGYVPPIHSVTLHSLAVGHLVHILMFSGVSHTVVWLGASWFSVDSTSSRNSLSQMEPLTSFLAVWSVHYLQMKSVNVWNWLF